MRISLSSTAELYAEHRRTASRRKRERIAAELQRRHDEANSRPGYGNAWFIVERVIEYRSLSGALVAAPVLKQIMRFDFALWLP